MAETATTSAGKKAGRENQYEAMFLLGPGGATEPQGMIDLCRGMIERHGGKVIVIKRWDERKLAYEIGGQKRGTYIISYFRAAGGAVAALERDVKLSEAVLRVLILRADHVSEQEMNAVEPQPIQPREERAPWDRPETDRRFDRGGDRGDRGDRPPRARRDEAASEGADKD